MNYSDELDNIIKQELSKLILKARLHENEFSHKTIKDYCELYRKLTKKKKNNS